MYRIPLLLLILLLCAANDAWADGDWTGTWEVHWRGSGGHMVMEQQGDTVTGRYPLYEGRIEGQVQAEGQGSRLDGRWFVGARSGKFIAVLGRDKRTFTGRFDDGEWWTGERTSQPESLPRIGLRTPREAFTRFVVAGNLARSGIDDAWGAAAEAVEFGVAPDLMTRTEQLYQIRNLFGLVDFTTFRYGSIPDPPPGADTVTVRLEQLRSEATVTLTMRRDSAGNWHILVPGEHEMAALRTALLAVYGGKPPTADAYRRLQNPRDAMRTFLEGMADWEGPGRERALSTLDLSALPELLRNANGEVSAQFLRRVLDHIGLVGLQSIPNDGANRDPYVHFVHGAGRIVIAPTGAAPDAPWKFTAQTIADIHDVFRATENLPPPLATPPGLIPPSPFFALRGRVAASAPFLLGAVGHVEYWQVLAALTALIAALAVARVAAWLICGGLRSLKGTTAPTRWFYWSLVLLLFVVIMHRVPGILGLVEGAREYTLPMWGIMASLAAGFVAWHLLRVIGDLLAAVATRTTTAKDDILFTLLLAAARLGVVFAVCLAIANFLSIPATHMLAGLSIGGLAFAFASRETLSNVFGAGILVTDRPFRRGDWIKAGEIEGSVEDVGIRSTRVRTAQDSVVVVPNGKLVDSTINNLGTRRHRLIKAQLIVTEGGTPEKLDAFTAALRQRIAGDPAFMAERTDVGLSGVTKDGVDVYLTSYLKEGTDSDESAARHALLLDAMRLAETSGLRLGEGMAKAK